MCLLMTFSICQSPTWKLKARLIAGKAPRLLHFPWLSCLKKFDVCHEARIHRRAVSHLFSPLPFSFDAQQPVLEHLFPGKQGVRNHNGNSLRKKMTGTKIKTHTCWSQQPCVVVSNSKAVISIFLCCTVLYRAHCDEFLSSHSHVLCDILDMK